MESSSDHSQSKQLDIPSTDLVDPTTLIDARLDVQTYANKGFRQSFDKLLGTLIAPSQLKPGSAA